MIQNLNGMVDLNGEEIFDLTERANNHEKIVESCSCKIAKNLLDTFADHFNRMWSITEIISPKEEITHQNPDS